MDDNRWNGLWGEISKLFNASLECSFPDLDKKCLTPFYNEEEQDGDCECQNVLTIWPELRNNPESEGKYPNIEEPIHVGKKIKEKISEFDMITDVSLSDVGFVTFSLSRKWITKSIHKMLKYGIDTWAPGLALKRVIVDYPSLDEEKHVDLFRRQVIGYTLIRMLEYSKVESTIDPRHNNCNPIFDFGNFGNFTMYAETYHKHHMMDKERLDILNNWYSTEEREDVVKIRKLPSIPVAVDAYKDFKQPFELAKRDFDNAYIDLITLWYGLVMQKADWIVYVTPVRQLEYIKMCFIVAELETWIPSGDKLSRTSYAGYRMCTTKLEDNMLDKAKTRCAAVAEGEAAKLLGYSPEAVLDCAFTYTCLKNHRLSLWTFDIDEMLEEEGNTFIYLLNRQAEIRKITNGSREDINELKKASELENDEGWGVGEERKLGWHLLQFTEEVEESCLSVLPHILCEYLYNLSQKFTCYFDKVGSVTDTSTLLLCEATAVVMEKCFHLLGITPECSVLGVSMTQSLPLRLQSSVKRPMDVKARDPPRTSRFELFSIRPNIDTDMRFRKGKLFGLISVSDKYGLLSDKGAEFIEPDFAHVRVFNHGWRDPINMRNSEPVHLGNPTSRHSVPVSSCIEVCMRLFVTNEEKDACFQLCNSSFEIGTSDFWDKESDSECGWVEVPGVDAITGIHYILLRDAVDTDLEVWFYRKTQKRVRGWIRAYYGRGFPNNCHSVFKECYVALLYETNPESNLEIGQISLKKSVLAVPVEGSLVIEAYILDVESEEVILDDRHEFDSQRKGKDEFVINGIETGCTLELKVNWKYQAYNLGESEAGSPCFVFENAVVKSEHEVVPLTDGNKPGAETSTGQGAETQAANVQGTVASESSGTSRKQWTPDQPQQGQRQRPPRGTAPLQHRGGGYQGRGPQVGYQGGQGGGQPQGGGGWVQRGGHGGGPQRGGGRGGGYQGRGPQVGYQGGGQPQGGRGWVQRGGHGGGPQRGGELQQYYVGPPDQPQQRQQRRPLRGTAPPHRRGGGPSRPSVPELYQATQAPQQPVATLQPVLHAESSSVEQTVDVSAAQFQQLSVRQEEPIQAAPASSKSLRFPLRPGLGSTGTRCFVKANHFFAKLPDKDLHQYDVMINPEVTSRGVNRAVMAQLVNMYRDSHLGKRLPAYDGRKSLYTAGPLPFVSKEFKITLLDEDDGSGSTRRERDFKVVIKLASRVDLHHLRMFLAGRQADAPKEALRVLDIVLRELPTNRYSPVGRSFYSPVLGHREPLGEGLESWCGFYQSIRPTQMGLSLNIDMSSTAFIEPLPIIDFVTQLLNRNVSARSLYSDSDRVKIEKALRGVKVEVTHRGKMRRKYRISGLTSQATKELNFPVDDRGTMKSVVEYFRETYGFSIHHVQWPCLQVGNTQRPSYLPMEVCKIVEGQRYPKRLNERQITALLRVTCQHPQEREKDILKTVTHKAYGQDPYAKEFGIKISTQLASVKARILPPPRLKYHYTGRTRDCLPQVGQWNMMNKKMVNGGTVASWICINFARNVQDNFAHAFCYALAAMCNSLGMAFNPEPVLPALSSRPDQVERILKAHFHNAMTKLQPHKKELDLLIVILPDNNGSLYGDLKRICETDLGIVSQCCLNKHVFRMSSQYLANVSLKINVKVGGRNTVLADALLRRIPNVSDVPTIIFGADVTHPHPGEDSSPSIAAVVASQDWPEITTYAGLVCAQAHRQELIQDLYKEWQDPNIGKVSGGMIRELLISFRRATGQKPQRIIFYRDGVSEGQFYQVLLYELDAIRKACASLEPNYQPPVTFVVVQKRHHTRLFANNHHDHSFVDRSGNILLGTVVDSEICHPTEFDFYLCSHAGIRGTSRPAHYHVLWDENKFSADDLQSLTNNLCYTYARCTRSVSIVPPAYYAHLAAFRARFYMDSDTFDTGSMNSGAAGRGMGPRSKRAPGANAAVKPLPALKENVKRVMFYC